MLKGFPRWTRTSPAAMGGLIEPAMRLNVFKSKIHRATVTHADVAYEGSVTIDRDLMDAAQFLPYEAVHIWNATRGTRLVTYVLEGPRGSGAICVNGAAAHLNQPGDVVILATFAEMAPEEKDAMSHRARALRALLPHLRALGA